MHRTQLIPRHAAVISRIRLGDVHNTKSLLVLQEKHSLGWEIAAHFGPGDFRGWPGINERDKETQ